MVAFAHDRELATFPPEFITAIKAQAESDADAAIEFVRLNLQATGNTTFRVGVDTIGSGRTDRVRIGGTLLALGTSAHPSPHRRGVALFSGLAAADGEARPRPKARQICGLGDDRQYQGLSRFVFVVRC